jgi:hypothetical protein
VGIFHRSVWGYDRECFFLFVFVFLSRDLTDIVMVKLTAIGMGMVMVGVAS